MGSNPIPVLDKEQVLGNLLESVSMKVNALEAVFNSQAQNIQSVVRQVKEGHTGKKGLIYCQKTILSVMQTSCEMQILLCFKLEKILAMMKKGPDSNQKKALNKLLQSLSLEENALTAFLDLEKRIIKIVAEHLSGDEYKHFQSNFHSIIEAGKQIQILVQSMQKKNTEAL